MDEVFLSYSLRKLSQHEVHQQGETTQSRDGLKLDRFHPSFSVIQLFASPRFGPPERVVVAAASFPFFFTLTVTEHMDRNFKHNVCVCVCMLVWFWLRRAVGVLDDLVEYDIC